MNIQTFGGNWTENKLVKLRKYLVAYANIMKDKKFNYAYIDAFAGTGYRTIQENEETDILIFLDLINQETNKLFDGSARIALQVEPKFNKYIFIEKDVNKANELNKLKTEFTDMAEKINIINSDANIYIKDICSKNWKYHRSVMFLDPFGMQVPWETIECIARTEAIDLWYLFPVGVAINRLLKKDGNIDEVIRKRLDETFGTKDWYDRFYQITKQKDLFGTYPITEKTADYNSICKYFIERLETVFAGVAKNPLLLCNSRNSPLYLLCFAAANKTGAKTAIKIAQDILKK